MRQLEVSTASQKNVKGVTSYYAIIGGKPEDEDKGVVIMNIGEKTFDKLNNLLNSEPEKVETSGNEVGGQGTAESGMDNDGNKRGRRNGRGDQ